MWRTTYFGIKFVPKIYEQQILQKVAHQNCNQHISMHPCIKFQSTWSTLGFGTKLAQNYMNDKVLNK